MLVELRIRDFAVVEDLTLELGPGLNVLTGETGAGKSIIVDALSLLLGERASSEDVRVGRDRAVVEAVFDVHALDWAQERLDELGLPPAEDGHLILRREVQAEGRNRAWVNGSPATATVVGRIGSGLVDLHGQHQHQTLLDRRSQRAVLDAFAGAAEAAEGVRDAHRAWTEARTELDAHTERVRALERQADFLRFQHGEIAEADVDPDEEDGLEAEASRLENARELVEESGRIAWGLSGGDESLLDRLAELRALGRRLASLDREAAPLSEGLENAWHLLSEVARDAEHYGEAIEVDGGRLEALQRRRDLLFRLKRKYGPELVDVVATGERLAAEVAELDAADRDLSRLESEVASRRSELAAAAKELTRLRTEAAPRFASGVARVLPALGMPDARLDVVLTTRDEVGAGGAEDVEFRISLNAGFEPRPLAKVASGGELSRIMLALKTVLAEIDRVPTLVFDEIDAGIGGAVANGVAEKLAEVSGHHQVFVITHLPQVASRARAHLLVEKRSGGDLVSTAVAALDGEERIREIARMLGGDPDSSASRDHARELLGAS